MTGKKGEICVSHRNHGIARSTCVVDATAILIDHDQVAATSKARTLVVNRRGLAHIGPDGSVERMTMHRYAHIFSKFVEFEMQWNAQRRGPIALDNVPVEIDPDELRGSEFVPCDEPRIAEQCAVTKIHGDMTSEMIGVSLTPQGSRQHNELLPKRQFRKKLIRCRCETHCEPPSRAAPLQASKEAECNPRH